MPKLEVEGVGVFEVPENKRLVLAIEEDAGVDILHRCGSYARCTTCRIEAQSPRAGKALVPNSGRPRQEGAGIDDR
jgi:ferredoxin